MILALARLLVLSAIVAFLGSMAASAQARIEADEPRRVGWFLGDVLNWSGRLHVPQGFELDPGTIPTTGPIDNFTEITSITVETQDTASGVRYDFDIAYQSFYVPLEPKEIAVPSIRLSLRSTVPGDETREDVAFPAWSVVLSPLRPILERSVPEAMRPEKPLQVIDTRGRQALVAGSWAALLVLAAGFGWSRGWGPARLRRALPFARAYRAIRRARLDTTAGYEAGLIEIHRGLDETFGHRIMAEDLAGRISHRADYRALSDELGHFFAASRVQFFGASESSARSVLPKEKLVELARRLAVIERSGRR
ncbi:hypothetical protein [Fulvimarina sp. MAC8]|uniref:hypothetical protein n=1 Tax=Fulvimarina sp. MAC8 TaxID=3162874 RepID=UPI0032ED4C07